MNSLINRLEYDSLIVEDLKGTITIQEGQVKFVNCGLKMFEGTANMSGVFDPTTSPQAPYFDFDFSINEWAIQPMAEAFNSIEKLAPILKSAKGNFSSKVHTTGVLDANLEPDLMKLSFSGDFRTKNMSITNSNLEKINAITKSKDFNPLVAKDLVIKYHCQNGVLETEPFTIPMGKQKATVSGYTTLAEDINYLIETKLKTSEMGAGAEELMKQLSNLVASTGVKPQMPDYIPLAIAVTGKVSDPQFKPAFGQFENSSTPTDMAKQAVKEKIEETKEDLKKEAKAEAEKIMADARKQQEQIMAEAKKQAELLKAEAKKNGDKLRAEADKQSQDLVKQATNPLTKIAAQKAGDELKKQADASAKKLESEADAQGKKIIAEAQKQSDKILEDAQKRADAKIEGL
jgi:cell division septum initiation protein DivIVA